MLTPILAVTFDLTYIFEPDQDTAKVNHTMSDIYVKGHLALKLLFKHTDNGPVTDLNHKVKYHFTSADL